VAWRSGRDRCRVFKVGEGSRFRIAFHRIFLMSSRTVIAVSLICRSRASLSGSNRRHKATYVGSNDLMST
jgi:hypothetical protein